MAKDKGQVRRVLQILSPEDQETLAILHDPPLMEELLRRQETLTEIQAVRLAAGVDDALADPDLAREAWQSLRVVPAVIDELAKLPTSTRDSLLGVHLRSLVVAPRQGLPLTQLFSGLWVSICAVGDVDYRLVYEIDPRDASVTILLIGAWESLERRLGAG